jgi:phosphorylcholine metabolism protein LicD
MIYWFVPRYKEQLVVLDIFVKTQDDAFTYWQASGKVMRVENKYYQSFESVPYQQRALRAPNHYKDYLTQKYGDWSVPVKEWDCSENELTIVKN